MLNADEVKKSPEWDKTIAEMEGWEDVSVVGSTFAFGYSPAGVTYQEERMYAATPRYTADLNAAMELLPKDVRVDLMWLEHAKNWACVIYYFDGSVTATDSNLAVAICRAYVLKKQFN